MTNITLINLPSPFLHDQLVMPPLGLCYVSSALKARDVDVHFLDLGKDGNHQIPRTDYYAMGCTTPQFNDAVLLKNAIDYPEAKFCLAGPHATVKPMDGISHGFDSVIVGEGEEAIFDVLNGREGIISKHDNRDLDSIAFPDRSLIQDYNYTIDGVRATTMLTSRGCAFHCSFCCKTWNNIRFRSYENVLQEAKDIALRGYGAIQLYDDEFMVYPERDLKIMRGFYRLGLIWRCFTRSDLVTRQLAFAMADCGCKEVLLGIESGSDEILNNINKGITVAEHKNAIQHLYNAGIRVKAAMVVGLPGENFLTGYETWRFCNEMDPFVSSWDFTNFVPYPGSHIYDHPEQYDIEFDPFDVYTPYKGGQWEAVVSTKSFQKEMVAALRNTLHRKFKGEIY